MPIEESFLDHVKLFAELTPDQRREIGGLAEAKTWGAGDVIYREGDPGDSLFLVSDGAVELATEIGEGRDRPLITVRPGQAFGLVEVIDVQPRAVTATAVEPTTALELTHAALAAFVEADPVSRVRVIYALSAGLARQSRIAMDLMRRNLAWTLEVSGALQLNLDRLTTDRIGVTVELINGKQISGILLKVEPSPAGHEILVKTDEGQVHLVPYHAMASVSFGAGEFCPDEDSAPDL